MYNNNLIGNHIARIRDVSLFRANQPRDMTECRVEEKQIQIRMK